MKGDLRDLVARKREELAEPPADEDRSLLELNEQMESLQVRKGRYEKLLRELQVTTRKRSRSWWPCEGPGPSRTQTWRPSQEDALLATVDTRIEQPRNSIPGAMLS